MLRVLLRRMENQRGAQIMEFALVLPLLMVFVVAIYDFGQAFNVKEKLNFAVKDGAKFGAAQPTNDLTQTIPVSVTAIRDLVDADLTAAGINDCGLGPITILPSSSLVWTATGICSENSTLTLTINRGLVFDSGTQGGSEPLKIIATQVDISYPYQWHLSGFLRLIAPNSTATGTTQIKTDAIAANQD